MWKVNVRFPIVSITDSQLTGSCVEEFGTDTTQSNKIPSYKGSKYDIMQELSQHSRDSYSTIQSNTTLIGFVRVAGSEEVLPAVD